jgi:ribosome-associated translation inhibitor RaiA
MNRITVVREDPSISPQACTYAEYRVFSVLTRHTPGFRRARVVLHQATDDPACDSVGCAVRVSLEPCGGIRIRVTGSHAYAAINRAVERLDQVLGKRVA